MQIYQKDSHNKQSIISLNLLLNSVMNRLSDLRESHVGCIPILRYANEKQWLTSKSGSWTGGFWLSVNFLLDTINGMNTLSNGTRDIARSIENRHEVDSVHMSMVGAYGFSFCCDYTDSLVETEFHTTLEVFKAGIAKRYRVDLGGFTLGAALGGREIGQDSISVDSLHAILILLGGDSNYKSLAKNHIDLYLEHSRFYNEVPGLLVQQDAKWVSAKPDQFWDRGHAWLILALAEAANLWGEKYDRMLKDHLNLWFSDAFNDKRNKLSRDTSADLMVVLAAINTRKLDKNSGLFKMAEERFWSVLNEPVFSIPTKDQTIYTGCLVKAEKAETIWGYFFLINTLLSLMKVKSLV